MSHGAEAATMPVAPEYQANARTLATSPIKVTATRGATQTVITAIHINPVSSVRLELSRPSTTSASTIAATANSIKAKPDDRVTGSIKASKGKNNSPAPIETPMAKITANSLRNQSIDFSTD